MKLRLPKVLYSNHIYDAVKDFQKNKQNIYKYLSRSDFRILNGSFDINDARVIRSSKALSYIASMIIESNRKRNILSLTSEKSNEVEIESHGLESNAELNISQQRREVLTDTLENGTLDAWIKLYRQERYPEDTIPKLFSYYQDQLKCPEVAKPNNIATSLSISNDDVIEAEKRFPGTKIISNDQKIKEIKILISKFNSISDTKINFLILGETGTGKELFAKAIHEASRRPGPFVPVNCSSIPENLFESLFFGVKKGAFTDAREDRVGYFEASNHGTLFLDEIGELPLSLQPRLLRVIQEHEIQRVGASAPTKIDVKMVFATNLDLQKMVDKGSFRNDLYMRINIFPLKIPPLRERISDLRLLAGYFIDKYDSARKKDNLLKPISISQECLTVLEAHPWPGNIREFENLIYRIMALKNADHNRDEIICDDLPDEFYNLKINSNYLAESKAEYYTDNRTKVTDDMILSLMDKHNNNKSRVAKELRVTYKTINRHCKNLNI